MVTESIKLIDLANVRSRFGRSIHLERDFYRELSLDGYVFTSTACSALDRMAQALSDKSRSRAWTLTGPYGSGKSAFALFAAKIFSNGLDWDTEIARASIRGENEILWQTLFDRRRKTAIRGRGLCPILVSGSRERIDRALLRGIVRSIKYFWPAKPPLLLDKVESLLKLSEVGEIIPSRTITEIIEQFAQKVCTSRNPACGLLIIVDELGKLLEYTAAHSTESDIFVLQELAEIAQRSTDQPILLVTTLHQAFDRYIERLNRSQKEEWMKIQGRFEDIAFQEPIEQVLKILSQAITHNGPTNEVQFLKQYGYKISQDAKKLRLIGNTKNNQILELLAGCVPLHPTVALTLGHLFRRLGQNERSLFVFLTSQEPYGFQEFLASTSWDRQRPATLRLDQVYDYIRAALGNDIYAQGDGRKWAEIEAAISRLTDPTELEVRLIKTIGILGIIGDIGDLKPSRKLLEFALVGGRIKPKEVHFALEKLHRRSIALYRRYRDAFSLWEGSDIDIEAKLIEANTQIDPNEPLTRNLTKYFKPRPIVARRHSSRTGTLRFYDVQFFDSHSFEKALDQSFGDADGLILYAIALNPDEVTILTRKASRLSGGKLRQVLIAIPQEITGLREAVIEVARLNWVIENTPELEGDRAARREIEAHLAIAERSVGDLLQWSFYSATNSLWYHHGVQLRLNSERALQEYISSICDEVFDKTPVIQNELINRRQPSSTAIGARNLLIEAMLTQGDKESLGIQGFPPQLSMYLSLLQETGIHRNENGGWGFFPPKDDSDKGIKAVWQAIDNFFTETENERHTIAELYEILKRPPYGMKSGPLPILLCAALLHYDTEIALYEQGSFVAFLSTAVFERLLKSPEKFQVQRCRVAGVRAAIFERLANALLRHPERALGEKPNLLAVVQSLARFIKGLPDYTKKTQRLSGSAIRIRSAILTAREPDQLLFVQLPEACGLLPFGVNDTRDSNDVDEFFKRLRVCLSELQRAYDDLLNELENLLITAFSLHSKGLDARNELGARAQPLLDLTVEPKLKSFIIRVIDQGTDVVDWVAAISGLLVNKPPNYWDDIDLARFEVSLAEIARSFRNIELISFELNKRGATELESGMEIIRLGVTCLREPERERVLSISQKDLPVIEGAQHSVEKALESAGLNGHIELRIAVLARLSRIFLEQLEVNDKSKHTEYSSLKS